MPTAFARVTVLAIKVRDIVRDPDNGMRRVRALFTGAIQATMALWLEIRRHRPPHPYSGYRPIAQ
ncbi:hypothetical protein [Nocardia sp. NPDC052112]|uniref:hypothetical protein n=1 Tax=Nocardia sp. NPDC052112 TaxID=3155646 RepID=UPI003442CE3A